MMILIQYAYGPGDVRGVLPLQVPLLGAQVPFYPFLVPIPFYGYLELWLWWGVLVVHCLLGCVFLCSVTLIGNFLRRDQEHKHII